MAKRVFNLRNVSEEEADEVRRCLTDGGIEFHESQPGPWGISPPWLWVMREEDEARARALIDDCQRQWSERVREEYRQLRERGEAETLWQRLSERPLQVLLALAVILLILYVTLKPFLDLARRQ